MVAQAEKMEENLVSGERRALELLLPSFQEEGTSEREPSLLGLRNQRALLFFWRLLKKAQEAAARGEGQAGRGGEKGDLCSRAVLHKQMTGGCCCQSQGPSRASSPSPERQSGRWRPWVAQIAPEITQIKRRACGRRTGRRRRGAHKPVHEPSA